MELNIGVKLGITDGTIDGNIVRVDDGLVLGLILGTVDGTDDGNILGTNDVNLDNESLGKLVGYHRRYH